ncbi:cytochrome P450 [Streptomyces sp. P38-E01]|uniref:Cytochrome P450 n=2 Tax=Streptomyces tardus TaxID=2780544 RepID=A0A949JHW9_9ACTN|nr:cytochrome P450 [Streptomyces tardus]
MPMGLVGWSVTRGDVARRLLTDRRVSKDARRSWPGYQPGRYPWLAAWVDVTSMLTSDGADHTRLRSFIGRAFSRDRINALRPRIETIVADLLNALDHDTNRVVDLRSAFSYPIPTRVICDLVGVPDEQRPAMLKVIDAVLDTSATPEQQAQTADGMYAAMTTLIDTKRAELGEDLTSVLLSAQAEDGDQLSEDELVSTLILMIGAGSETAVSLINHSVASLLTHLDQLNTVQRHGRWDDVIDEALRLHPPIMHLPLRYATEDIDLGDGTVIRRGDLILISYGAHGRDPSVHRDPDHFDIDRANTDNLAFGHGIHYCLGAPLARLEARIALQQLFARFPGLELASDPGELERRPSFIGNDFHELPVRLQRARPAN